MSEIKEGDVVWVRTTVGYSHIPNCLRTEPSVASHWPVDELVPDHPALPALARWLHEKADDDVPVWSDLHDCLIALDYLSGHATNGVNPLSRETLRSLVKVLRTEREG